MKVCVAGPVREKREPVKGNSSSHMVVKRGSGIFKGSRPMAMPTTCPVPLGHPALCL